MSAVALAETTETTKERLSYKHREINRAAKFVHSLNTLHGAASAIGAKPKALELIEAAAKAVEAMATQVLATMPENLEPPRGSQSHTAEVGDVVNATESDAYLYQKADKNLTVKEVVKHGGNEAGKGAKIFLKCVREDGTKVTVPASHFE